MPQSLKQIKNRIRGVGNTMKVTNAMQMISATKLSRVDKQLFQLRSYYGGLERLMLNLTSCREDIQHPCFQEPLTKENFVLCVITSDSGLCGLYNQNVLREAEKFIARCGAQKVSLIVIGRRAAKYFKNKGIKILNTYAGLHGGYGHLIADQITGILVKLFLAKKADEVHVAYTYFRKGILQNAVVEKFLNLRSEQRVKINYIFEDGLDNIVDQVVLRFLLTRMRFIFLQAFTSEHASRSIAMKAATDNAKQLLSRLVVVHNKIRQSNITQEMLEIISSSQALKG